MAADNNLNLLKVENVSWGVGNKLILDDLSFSVCPGEFVGVIGPNGSGKSSLLRCLYAFNQPQNGQILIGNKKLSSFSRMALARKIAVVLQEPPTQFELSVNDVVKQGLTPQKALFSFDSANDEGLVEHALEKVDLAGKFGQMFNSLSGGEKQRAMIARAIVQNTDFLLMDEPTNHLDIKHQIDVLQLAKSLGITVIVTLHDLNLAAAYCHRLILLNEGRLVAQGPPEEVLSESNLAKVFSVEAIIDSHPIIKKRRITINWQGADQ